MSTLRGGCHCGGVTVEFETAVDPGTLPLRACQCSFCRKHGARTTSDPAGRLRISVRDPDLLLRYRFALGITDFFVCKTCGVYVGATLQSARGALGTLNVNVLDKREPFLRQAEPVSYFRESVEQRMSRRLLAWMPVEVRI